MFSCYYRFLGKKPDHNWAVGETAKHLQFTRGSVTSAVQDWKSNGEIRVASRSSGPTGGRLTADVKRHLTDCVDQLNREGDVTLAKLLQAMLRTPPSSTGVAGGDESPGAGASRDEPENGRKWPQAGVGVL